MNRTTLVIIGFVWTCNACASDEMATSFVLAKEQDTVTTEPVSPSPEIKNGLSASPVTTNVESATASVETATNQCAQPTEAEKREEEMESDSACQEISEWSDKTDEETTRRASKKEMELCKCERVIYRIFNLGEKEGSRLCAGCVPDCPGQLEECSAKCAFSKIASGESVVKTKNLAEMIAKASASGDRLGVDKTDLGAAAIISGRVLTVETGSNGRQSLKAVASGTSEDHALLYFEDNIYGNDISCYRSVSPMGTFTLIHLADLPKEKETKFLCQISGRENVGGPLYFQKCVVLEQS